MKWQVRVPEWDEKRWYIVEAADMIDAAQKYVAEQDEDHNLLFCEKQEVTIQVSAVGVNDVYDVYEYIVKAYVAYTAKAAGHGSKRKGRGGR